VDSISPHILDLKKKINLLLSRHKDLIANNALLKNDKLGLLEKNECLEDEIKELKKRIEVVDVVKGISKEDSDSTSFARVRVNNLIRQIDKCIALLNE
tara:strand:- start:946 stop:1239 length:294 start_codon:yes stop_codon:yes gene_type:complete